MVLLGESKEMLWPIEACPTIKKRPASIVTVATRAMRRHRHGREKNGVHGPQPIHGPAENQSAPYDTRLSRNPGRIPPLFAVLLAQSRQGTLTRPPVMQYRVCTNDVDEGSPPPITTRAVMQAWNTASHAPCWSCW